MTSRSMTGPAPFGPAGLAHDVIAAQGDDPSGFCRFVTHSFLGERQIVPHAAGDSFSASIGLFLAGPGDTVGLFVQPPGVLAWHTATHLAARVDALETAFPLSTHEPDGYAGAINRCLLNSSLLRAHVNILPRPPALITTFPDPSTRNRAASLGIAMPQRADASPVNDKVYFRERAEVDGFEVCPGLIMRDSSDLRHAVRLLGRHRYGVWVKSDGSGGDTVVHVPRLTRGSLALAVQEILSRISEAQSRGACQSLLDPTTGFPPGGLVVEADVRALGDVIGNISSTVYTSHRGEIDLRGLYLQHTIEGRWRGSTGLVFDDEVARLLRVTSAQWTTLRACIQRNCQAVGRAALAARYYGLHGQDFFIVRTASGEHRIVNTEINGRISTSGIAHAAAAAAGASHFALADLYGRRRCTTLDEFRAHVTVNGTDLLDSNPAEGAAWPMAFEARWETDANGAKRLVCPSNRVRVLFMAGSSKALTSLRAQVDGRFLPQRA
jgi:hypothetical protein